MLRQAEDGGIKTRKRVLKIATGNEHMFFKL